jgi:hypothetical protein
MSCYVSKRAHEMHDFGLRKCAAENVEGFPTFRQTAVSRRVLRVGGGVWSSYMDLAVNSDTTTHKETAYWTAALRSTVSSDYGFTSDPFPTAWSIQAITAHLKDMTLKSVTAYFTETFENLQHSAWSNPESRSRALTSGRENLRPRI